MATFWSGRGASAVMVFLGPTLGAFAGNGFVDLTALENYAHQPVPAYVTRTVTPAGNPITDAGATLGRVLFYDRRLSRNDTISCASCHQQERAFSDTATASTGVGGTTGRHAMRLINAGAGAEVKFFWDERAASLEVQTTQPIQDHAEMGFSGANGDPALADLLVKLAAIPEYRVLFTVAFGDAGVTEDRLQRALAQFVRSIQSFDSRYDQGRAQVGGDGANFPNLTAAENAGKQSFLQAPGNGGAGCAACHQPPEFAIDPNSRNNGVTTKIGGGTDLTNTRSPTLRDLVGPGGRSNGAFMHDGSMATLARVIDHYNAIPANNTNLDPRLRRPGGGGVQTLNLTATQKDNLVAFLATLTGSAVYTAEKLADPFDAQPALSLNVWRGDTTTLRYENDGRVTLTARAAAGLTYRLQGSPEGGAAWTNLAAATPDAAGALSTTLAPGGHAQFRYALEVPGAEPTVYAATVPVALELPAITTEPQSQAAALGTRVELNVAATSPLALSYQWHKAGAPLAGETGASLVIASFQTIDAGEYRVVVSSAAGSVMSAIATLSVVPTLAAWREENFTLAERADAAVSGPAADPDGDGWSNLLEYALGLEPKIADTSGGLEVSVMGSEWVATYARPGARTDLSYAVEVSTDLVNWTVNGVTHALISTDAGSGRQMWHSRYPLASAPTLFFRLKVMASP